MSTRHISAAAFAVATLALGPVALTACGGGSDNQSGATTVDVKLREYKVLPAKKSAKRGNVNFDVRNTGTVEHEFVVVKTDGTALPTAADGSVDEDKIAETAKFGEVEDLSAKDSGELRAKGLAPGTYTLFCNIVDASGSHYAHGMHTTFTVR